MHLFHGIGGGLGGGVQLVRFLFEEVLALLSIVGHLDELLDAPRPFQRILIGRVSTRQSRDSASCFLRRVQRAVIKNRVREQLNHHHGDLGLVYVIVQG